MKMSLLAWVKIEFYICCFQGHCIASLSALSPLFIQNQSENVAYSFGLCYLVCFPIAQKKHQEKAEWTLKMS